MSQAHRWIFVGSVAALAAAERRRVARAAVGFPAAGPPSFFPGEGFHFFLTVFWF